METAWRWSEPGAQRDRGGGRPAKRSGVRRLSGSWEHLRGRNSVEVERRFVSGIGGDGVDVGGKSSQRLGIAEIGWVTLFKGNGLISAGRHVSGVVITRGAAA